MKCDAGFLTVSPINQNYTEKFAIKMKCAKFCRFRIYFIREI